ncbi:uncharacterized protein LOC129597844 [Paramacrobiotus metropolitanus]|uniref:uncharacterized protein LOC129597844 n=1 Tax=Paramacrobiotus metropolitanus TaxID=2943436 RepID=UPI002445FE3A|nr:uncharacterized protein LOC129597844 [Paramacrobiotus metropolitanus]
MARKKVNPCFYIPAIVGVGLLFTAAILNIIVYSRPSSYRVLLSWHDWNGFVMFALAMVKGCMDCCCGSSPMDPNEKSSSCRSCLDCLGFFFVTFMLISSSMIINYYSKGNTDIPTERFVSAICYLIAVPAMIVTAVPCALLKYCEDNSEDAERMTETTESSNYSAINY